MQDIIALTLKELSGAMLKGEIRPKEALEAYLEQIEAEDKKINAYISLDAENALKKAEKIKPDGFLSGIPMAVKDNICVKGLKTTCASKMLENFVPPYSACAYEKLENAGCVLMGKLNMDEFAMGSTTETSYFGPTRNPVDLSRVPGGSSGGSAAAVKAGEAPFALGSDTGGSIRQPAAFCGVVGLKPTYGRVSRYGLVAFASSLDQIGPITRNVEDNALVLQAIAGPDSRDATSAPRGAEDFASDMEKGVDGLKIGLPREFYEKGINPEVKAGLLKAAEGLEKLGAEIMWVDMPTLDYALPAYYVLSSAEASSNLARFDGVRYGYRSDKYEDITQLYINSRSEGFGAEVKRRIMLGTFALSSGYYDAYYKKALQARALVSDNFSEAFKKCDVLLTPVAPTTAYKLGEKINNPLEMYMGDMYTVPVNIAGVPALSLPCGEDANRLPISAQLIGPHFSERLLYRVGKSLEGWASSSGAYSGKIKQSFNKGSEKEGEI